MPFVKMLPFLLREDELAPLAGDALTVPPAEDCPPPDGGTTMTRKGGQVRPTPPKAYEIPQSEESLSGVDPRLVPEKFISVRGWRAGS